MKMIKSLCLGCAVVLVGVGAMGCAGQPKPMAKAEATAEAKPAAKAAVTPDANAAAPAVQVPSAFAEAPAVGTKVRCPVSGETFAVIAGSPRSEHGGKHYAFCCPPCKAKFDADPAKYVKK